MPRQFPTTPASYSKNPRPSIQLSPVKSSQIKEIGYDGKTKTLAVTFNHGVGALYCYPGVSPEIHQAFLKAKSIGKFFGEHIQGLPFEKFPPDAKSQA